ncbi:unnamed protein product [Sphagnum jensenii]
MPIPLMIMGDAPTAGSGLGRIAGDLARRIAENMSDVFRVCTFGYGGLVSRHLPYHQYIMDGMKEGDWVTPTLPEVWRDWAGAEKGIILTIWDISRLGWLLRPEMQCESLVLREFLMKKPFKIWSYIPIHAEGPNQKLTFPLRETIKGADRLLSYGKWGGGVVDESLEIPQGTTQYLPHGVDTTVFYPRDRAQSRKDFVSYTQARVLMGNLAERVKSDEVLVSIIATNQARKDYGLGIETVALLAKNHNVRLWVKSDVPERHWSIPALLLDYGLQDRAMMTFGELTDEDMAKAYSASDLVLGIAPEGFGFVHVESLACGTPCITGSYGGGAELVTKSMRIDPIAFRYEGVWTEKRPVYNAFDWARRAEHWIQYRATMDVRYDWVHNWMGWLYWLLKGIYNESGSSAKHNRMV